MIPFQTKLKTLSGTSYGEVKKQALIAFKEIERRTRRKPYVRSAYFKKQKIFFDYFWPHLFEKSPKNRFKRLKYFEAAIELIKYSRNSPSVKPNPNKKDEILYRFAGLTLNKELFYVQIKENKKNNKKYFMSCFPPE